MGVYLRLPSASIGLSLRKWTMVTPGQNRSKCYLHENPEEGAGVSPQGLLWPHALPQEARGRAHRRAQLSCCMKVTETRGWRLWPSWDLGGRLLEKGESGGGVTKVSMENLHTQDRLLMCTGGEALGDLAEGRPAWMQSFSEMAILQKSPCAETVQLASSQRGKIHWIFCEYIR